MKITKTKLVEIIKEELDAVLAEEEGSGEESTDELSYEEWLENLTDEEKEKIKMVLDAEATLDQWKTEFNRVFYGEDEPSADEAYEAANKHLLLPYYRKEKYLDDFQSEVPPADDPEERPKFQAYPPDALPF